MEPIKKIFTRVFKIKTEEFSLVQSLFLFFTTIGIFFTLGAAAGDTLLLSQFGEESEKLLPFVYIGVAFSSIFVTWIYDRCQGKVSRIVLLVVTFSILSLSILFSRFLFYFISSKWLYYFLVIWLETCSLTAIMMFFSFSGDYFTTFDARRVYGYISGGLPFGTIIAGFIMKPLVSSLGILNILFVIAFLLALSAFLVIRISLKHKPVLSSLEEKKESNEKVALKKIFENKYIVYLVIFVFISFICFRLVEYLFQIKAVSEMQGERLALFFGNFYSYLGIVQIVIQFGLVSFLFKKLGAVNSLMLLPLFIIFSNILYLIFPSLLIVWASGNFFRLSFSETVDIPATELLFLPLPKKMRLRVQALFSGALIPLGSGLGGLLILFLLTFIQDLSVFTYLTILVSFLYLAFILLIKPQYKKMLSSSLKEKNFSKADMDFLFHPEIIENLFQNLLKTENTEQILLTLEILSKYGNESVIKKFESLIYHPNEKAALLALEILGEKIPLESIETIYRTLKHPSALLRAKAILLISQIRKKDALQDLLPFLQTEDLKVRSSVITALLIYGDAKEKKQAEELQQKLLLASDKTEILAGIAIYKTASHLINISLIRSLLQYFSSLEIQQAILSLCQYCPEKEIISLLIEQLNPVSLRLTALKTLEQMTKEICPHLISILREKKLSFFQKQTICALLKTKGNLNNLDVLFDIVLSKDESFILKVSAGQAIRGICQRENSAFYQNPKLFQCIETAASELRLVHKAYFEIISADPLVAAHFWDRGLLLFDILISSLFVLGKNSHLKKIENNLLNSNNVIRSNAIELLEFSLPSNLKDTILLSVSSFIKKETEEGKEIQDETKKILKTKDPWLRGLVLYYETRKTPMAKGEINMEPEDKNIFHLISKATFLKQVKLFQEVPSEYLIHLAEVTKTKEFLKGEILVREGDEGDSLFLIEEGEIEIQKNDQTIARLGNGECIGEMALIEDLPRSATCVAGKDTKVLSIDREDFSNLMDTQPQIVKALLVTMTKRLRAMG